MSKKTKQKPKLQQDNNNYWYRWDVNHPMNGRSGNESNFMQTMYMNPHNKFKPPQQQKIAPAFAELDNNPTFQKYDPKDAFCLYCQKKTKMEPSPRARYINNRFLLGGNCSVCGKKVSTFVSKQIGMGRGGDSIAPGEPAWETNKYNYSTLYKFPPIPGESCEDYKDRINILLPGKFPGQAITWFCAAYQQTGEPNAWYTLDDLNQKGRYPAMPKHEITAGQVYGSLVNLA